jgi:protein-tyrosine phosphatase
MHILMVCLGNICRSPLAEGILAHKAQQQGLDWQIDSAGTGNWHAGNQPDSRSVKVAKQHGVDISKQRARQFRQSDFQDFDLILVMDKSNYRNVTNLAQSEAEAKKVQLILDYTDHQNKEVPDPYHDDNGFEHVYQLLDAATDRVLEVHLPAQ